MSEVKIEPELVIIDRQQNGSKTENCEILEVNNKQQNYFNHEPAIILNNDKINDKRKPDAVPGTQQVFLHNNANSNSKLEHASVVKIEPELLIEDVILKNIIYNNPNSIKYIRSDNYENISKENGIQENISQENVTHENVAQDNDVQENITQKNINYNEEQGENSTIDISDTDIEETDSESQTINLQTIIGKNLEDCESSTVIDDLLEYVRTTSGSYTCDICQVKFYKLKHLKNHINSSHIGRTNYQQKRAIDKKKNELQVIREDVKTLYTCTICSKEFQVLSFMISHMVFHTKVLVKCKICLKQFSHIECLKRHMLSHSKQKYICNICNKSFLNTNLCELHLMMHST